jgi:glycosyltransferase involved in cell wall biosynthesis
MVIYPPVFDDVVAETHGNAVGFIKPIPHKGADLVYQIARLCPDREFVVLRGEWQTLEILSDLPNVVFVEPVDDIRDFWAAVRVVLVPSVNEDAGTVAQEAALNGVPCLSSNVGGLIETNGGGIILDTRDPMSWAVHLEAVLNDRDVYDAVAQRQRDYVAGWKQTELIDAFAYKIAALREGVKA